MQGFSSFTQEWFRHAFANPTSAQQQAWPAIQSGDNALVIAPTGSGKTLAAFLSAIDRLVRFKTSVGKSDPAHDAAVPPAITAGKTAAEETRDLAHSGAIHDPAAHSRGKAAKPKRAVRVLYISPLKALAVDVAKNLEEPLGGITEIIGEQGIPSPDIRVAIRSGDTSAKERRAIAAHPPDILVTTPESLYLLLTSKARRILTTVDTVIIDEVHAVAGSKRGAHLAVSLERLDELSVGHVQRIGLSATVKPAQEVARFLSGSQQVTIVDAATHPAMDVRVVEPLANMQDTTSTSRNSVSASMNSHSRRISGVNASMERLARGEHTTVSKAPNDSTGSIWPAIERDVLDEVLKHRTTLVFVNSRGLAERLTARLNDLYAQRISGRSPVADYGNSRHYDSVVGSSSSLVGSHDAEETIAMAHHGSVAKDRRKMIEERLKTGRLRCVVATSSLELGIDMGTVDLVIQIAPPLSVSSGLQRVGRADHQVGGVSHALFYPLTREHLIGITTTLECMRSGDIEPLQVLNNPLDILAQQTVAAAAMEDLDPDQWYGMVRRSAPFAHLGRDMFDSVIDMLTGTYNTEEFSAFRPPLMRNDEQGLISARPGAQRLAVTSGGTIPDRGAYTVVIPEADAGSGPRRVGELDEEMVYESRVGDVLTLGTSTWQIQDITNDRVVVVPAPGRTARLPFWHGEGPGRDAGFGAAKGRFVREISAGLIHDGDVWTWDDTFLSRLRNDGLDDNACHNMANLLGEQRASTGNIPDDRTMVLERCEDEEGDWRLILHSPYGRRVHEPWAMAISNRLKARYGFDAQSYASDDGIVMRVPQAEHDMPLDELILFDTDELLADVEEQVGDSVLFAARFRECAARSLYLPRTKPGKRIPLWLQRLRSSQLLQAAKTQHNFPLLLETARECLQDVYDMPSLHRIMTALHNGDIALYDVTTSTPSPFAETILFGFIGSVMYQYDVPQAERNASLLSMDPEVLQRLIGGESMSTVLDGSAIEYVEDQLKRLTFWNTLDASDITGRIVRFAKTHGPFTADAVVNALHIDALSVVRELDTLKAQGEIVVGKFTVDAQTTQYLHRDVFRRIRNRSRTLARKAIRPVAASTYQAYVAALQCVDTEHGQLQGTEGLTRVIEQLEGVALPASVWEHDIFPARILDYQPSMLDELLSEGTIVWVGSQSPGSAMLSQSGLISWYLADSPLLAQHAELQQVLPDTHISIDSAVLEILRTSGAYHLQQLVQASHEWYARALLSSAIHMDVSGETNHHSPKDRNVEDVKVVAVNVGDAGTRDTRPGGAQPGGAQPGGAQHSDARSADTEPVSKTSDNMMSVDAPTDNTVTGDKLAGNRLNDDMLTDDTMSVDMVTGELLPYQWSADDVERSLWNLAWSGNVTNTSFAPIRELMELRPQRNGGAAAASASGRERSSSAPRRYSSLQHSSLQHSPLQNLPLRHSYMRRRVPASPASHGLWLAVGGVRHVPEQVAIARVDALLDRYGIIAQPIVDKELLQGGFSGLYPVLKRMEETGDLIRGIFVSGMSAAQFATKETVDALRRQRHQEKPMAGSDIVEGDREPRSAANIDTSDRGPSISVQHRTVVLDSLDPANLYGSTIPWPDVMPVSSKRGEVEETASGNKRASRFKPTRRAGTVVVIVDGSAVMYAAPHAHHLMVFDMSDASANTEEEIEHVVGSACAALVVYLRRTQRSSTTFTDINGVPLAKASRYTHMLRQAGFAPNPRGMTLYQ